MSPSASETKLRLFVRAAFAPVIGLFEGNDNIDIECMENTRDTGPKLQNWCPDVKFDEFTFSTPGEPWPDFKILKIHDQPMCGEHNQSVDDNSVAALSSYGAWAVEHTNSTDPISSDSSDACDQRKFEAYSSPRHPPPLLQPL